MQYINRYISPIGNITMASDGEALTGLWFDGQKHFGSTLNEPYQNTEDDPIIALTKQWLERYFSGIIPDFTPPLELCGSEFQLRVWHQLLTIPYGETRSYGQIARRISPTMSAQAVGNAVGRNPISIIIPCHRVISSEGTMTGYAGGLERKIELLKIERQRKKR